MSNVSESAGAKTATTQSSRVARVLNLSILFVGIGLHAGVGFAMHYLKMFSAHQTTYFSVGAAIGLIGLLLWLVAR
ncbi:hypothetical protein [Natrinema sp. SYSU A 869]|uniref:hypothetical protein n=1 Tax=Natrinema sp. SYSU A 869 TaxID=2871694 RepID=UPI001CA3F29D|nr:hypothetical protein [Natrinema sp. SYSU A 869]